MKLLQILFITLLVSSCSLNIKKNFDNYQPQFLGKTDFMPSKEELQHKSPKVVVFSLDENNNAVSTQSNLGKSIADYIEGILSRERLAEIVDRSANKKLANEIALNELKGKTNYKGPKIADYAISGSISNASFTSKYVNGSTYVDPNSLRVVTIPPQYKYSSSVSGNIKIFELPSLTAIDTVEFKANKSRAESVKRKGGFSLGALQIGGENEEGVKRDDGLVREAALTAIQKITTNLKNIFAKTGYILEKRQYEKKTIFKISLGALDGLKKGDKVEITGKYEVENPITEEIEIENRIIAQGKVSDKIDPKTSWIVINNSKNIDKIRLGDKAKLKYKQNFFAKLFN
ncbi:MAG: hypothetical protein ISQ34_01490 [Rickettsiales bacterium]|nr:hypothetical protein [Rickettsiales bacterium]